MSGKFRVWGKCVFTQWMGKDETPILKIEFNLGR